MSDVKQPIDFAADLHEEFDRKYTQLQERVQRLERGKKSELPFSENPEDAILLMIAAYIFFEYVVPAAFDMVKKWQTRS